MTNMHNIEELESQLSQSQNGDTSFLRSCFNGLNALTGIGIVSIPYALSEGGWMSLIALFFIAILCFYTGLLLNKCMVSNPLIKSYPDIGEQAFGNKGKIIISIIMYVELFLVAFEFLIMEGDNLHNLFPNVCVNVFKKNIGGKQVFILIAALVILPTTWLRSLNFLAYLSVGGILSSLILLSSVFWIGTFEGVGFHEKGDVWRYDGLAIAISLYTFCYCGHAVFPTLRTSMKDKRQFPKVLLVCFVLSTINYGLMAILGYLMYGEDLKSQVTLNLPTKNIISKIAIYTTLISPITKYAMIISPITTALEERLMRRNNKLLSIIIRTIVVIGTVIVAIFVPFFGYVMAFIGGFTGISASILFPCLCYLKIKRESRNFEIELIFIMVILFLGFVSVVVGTFTSISDIVKHVS
ncbi:Amino acid transporter [Handroanthus impetiginosus]|uniref:Amino acid transporter n=1 Tax=Handroanthus impetiginosus TaxID=429701 RepID=A0A2G9I2P7_9LAMI|nr:Amino acid transporter [Handroanthus impetiginosus]